MLNRKFCCLLVVASCLFGLNARAQQDSKNDDAFAQVLKSEAQGLSQTSLDEIIEIRKRLGGGTGLGLNDLFENFDLKLDRPRAKSEPQSVLDDQKPHPNQAKTLSEKLFFQMLQSTQPIHVGRNPQPDRAAAWGDSKDDRVSNIRETARRVDQLAADLEDLEMFGDADSLRNLAAEIRQKVRRNSRTARSTREFR